ncbi:CotH kinase family protein [Acetivibrio straminisolvens]|jgi:hypothetical protein|nr:CotH kinase family protein [Acetivibrio straminisolvens]
MKKIIGLLLSAILATNFVLSLAQSKAANLEQQHIYINELMASNKSTVRDGDLDDPKHGASGGAYSDWIELYNASNEPVDLTGCSISDDGATWVFPQGSIPPKGYLVIWASDKDKVTSDGQLHTNFKLSADGERVVLKSPDGSVIDSVTYGRLADDESYGRNPDGSDEFTIFSKATPNASNNNSHAIVLEPVFSHQAGFYTEEFELELSANQENTKIYYTLDGSDPKPGESGTFEYSGKIKIKSRAGEPNVLSMINTGDYYWNPPLGEVFKCTVVKAAAVRTDGQASRTVTRSYFVDSDMMTRYSLPVISIVTDKANLFDKDTGIYLNSNKSGADWERPAHIEFFENNGTPGFSHYCGIRLHGGGSKGFAQKSLRIYADRGYDYKEKISYDIFPGLKDKVTGKSITDFKRLILRNSGNDWSNSMFRDALMHKLVSHLNLDTQAYRPSVVFINGEYWGIHNIRERYDNIYFASHYNLDKDNVVLLEVTYLGTIVANEGTDEDVQAYTNEIIDFLKSNDITQKDNYEYIKTKMDVDNFIDYNVANIYFANNDWPQNNVTMWKYKTKDGLYHPEAPYGQDGRWRWIIKDTDFGFGGPFMGSSGVSHNTLNHASENTQNEWAVFLFKKLLENSEFRNAFINRMADYLNTCFDPELVTNTIDEMKDAIASSIPEHNARWQAISDWDGEIELMRTFAKRRPDYVTEHIISKFRRFGVTGTYSVKLETDSSMGFIRINSIDLKSTTRGVNNPEAWTGKYFKGVPLTIKAIPKEGYVFERWEGTDEASDTLVLTPTKDISLKAVFKKASSTECKISGYVKPDLFSKADDIKADFKVEVLGLNVSALTDKDGYFELTVPESNTGYVFKISKTNYLSREIKKDTVLNDMALSSKESPLILWAGDVEIDGISDGAINLIDIMEVAKAFNTTPADEKYKADMDFNKNNAINMEDIVIIAKHFSATSDDYE